MLDDIVLARRVLSDPAIVSSDPSPAAQSHRRVSVLEVDGALHARLRRAIEPFTTRAHLDGCVTAVDSAAVDAVARWRHDSDEVELVERVVTPVVLTCLFEALEVDRSLRARIEEPIRTLHGSLEPDRTDAHRTRAREASLEIATVFRRHRTPVGVHQSLLAASDRGEFPTSVAHLQMPVLLHGGSENPINLLGQVLVDWLTATGPESGASGCGSGELGSGPSGDLSSRAVRSVFARSAPVRGVIRWAVDDIGYAPFKAGESIWVAIDVRSCRTSERDRGGGLLTSGLEFGFGAHRCPGLPLVPVMVRALWKALSPVLPVDPNMVRFEHFERFVTQGVRTLIVAPGGAIA